MLKVDLAGEGFGIFGRFGFRLFGLHLDQLKQTSRTGDRVLQLGDDAGDLVERLGVLVCVAQRTRELTD